MKIKKLLFAFLIALSAGVITSCSDDNNNAALYEAQVNWNAPASLNDKSFAWVEGNLIMKEINTGKETSFTLPVTALPNLPAGQYNASVEGKISHADDNGGTAVVNVRGSKENITVKEGGVLIDIDLIIYSAESSFVFSEIYCTGSLNANGTSGITGDKFFKIYNNSGTVQYADGIAILECVLGCIDEFTYSPDPRNEGFATQVVYVIPGNGTEHPIQPGESIVITDQASNHFTTNANAIDLSGADYEWYDETDKGIDTDNPSVPNLDRWYSYSATIWTPNSQGNRAYAIARIGVEKSVFTKDYYHDDWSYVNTGVTKYKKGYLVPNEWILDAVNICPATSFHMLGTSSALDKSYISISNAGNSVEQFGKSIRRKTAGEVIEEDGTKHIVLLDTNDSASDFTVGTVSYKK